MSGKGSNRRPQEAPDEQVAANWDRIFGGGNGQPIPAVIQFYEQDTSALDAHVAAHPEEWEKLLANHKDVE